MIKTVTEKKLSYAFLFRPATPDTDDTYTVRWRRTYTIFKLHLLPFSRKSSKPLFQPTDSRAISSWRLNELAIRFVEDGLRVLSLSVIHNLLCLSGRRPTGRRLGGRCWCELMRQRDGVVDQVRHIDRQ